jgi:hypothetical protein
VFEYVEWMMADAFCSVFVCQEAWCGQLTTTNLLGQILEEREKLTVRVRVASSWSVEVLTCCCWR